MPPTAVRSLRFCAPSEFTSQSVSLPCRYAICARMGRGMGWLIANGASITGRAAAVAAAEHPAAVVRDPTVVIRAHGGAVVGAGEPIDVELCEGIGVALRVGVEGRALLALRQQAPRRDAREHEVSARNAGH